MSEDRTRKLPNWIDAFIEQTANLGSPRIFRLWIALSTIAAAIEQKVWVTTSEPLYPNLYTFIIGHPGVGKSRAIAVGRKLYNTLPEPALAPISLTFASVVDTLLANKRSFVISPHGEVKYHSMYICADEMGTFIHKYEPDMIDGLSAFYDAADYSQARRTGDLRIKIPRAQVNMLAGSTPQNLMGFMPEKAWGQGFTSRIIMIFSDERVISDIFAPIAKPYMDDLAHDLKLINSLQGQFTVTEAFRNALFTWRKMGEPPVPDHPKLMHYITRRHIHILRLAMLASINESSGLVLTEANFFQACEWLFAAEHSIPDIFKAGAVNADAAAMDEIHHFVKITDQGTGISEQRIIHFARERVPITSILRIIEIMENSGMLRQVRQDKRTGARFFSATSPDRLTDPSAGLPTGIDLQ